MNDNEIVQSTHPDFNNTPSSEEIEEPEEKNLFQYCLFSIKNKFKFFRETVNVSS